MSIIITHASGAGELPEETNADLVLFESLVREYCGVGFFECLDRPPGEHLTSALWEETGSRPPALFRTVVELLHRAAVRESE